MPPARVVSVAPGSPADHAGLQPGDELLSVNGEELTDVIRYQVRADEADLALEVRRGGLEHPIMIDKAPGAPLGLELASAVFDRVRTCDNHCPFCFIHQLPRGMRPSLSVRDDDYRLSFLYGNFTTLTRFTEADLERVVEERLEPLYVSIHATDPELRTRLLRNRRGATSLRWLRALLDAGIEVHGQIVVCPGINDGAALDETLLGILDRYPELATVGVVPLGVSAHNREPDLRPHTAEEAAAVVDLVARWQERFLATLGRRLVFTSDEYHLLAGRRLPPLDDYEGVPQHENGVGIVRTFEHDARRAMDGEEASATGVRSGFFAWVDGAPAEGYRAARVPFPAPTRSPPGPRRGPMPVTILTGTYAERVLRPLVDELAGRARGASSKSTRGSDGTISGMGDPDVDVVAVDNAFFGGNIAVAGLLTGTDIARVLASAPPERRYLLPDVMLSGGRFLDGLAVADLPRPVEVVPTDGASLARTLLRRG